MSFLAPWFLAGLALLAVPVIIHLVNRERKAPLPFPSLMFVRRVPYKSTRRRRLRDLPLFLLRCLAVLLIAAAFARPLLDLARGGTAPGTDGREVVILLDRSYSMGAEGGARWQRAVQMARAAVDGIGPHDRATVVAFDATPAALTEATVDRAALRRAVDSLRVGSGVTRYGPALALASRILGRSELPHREAVLISDFQRAGWREDPEARLPAGATLTPVDVGGALGANVAVTDVELHRDLVDGRELVRATARVVAAGGDAPRDVPVSLEIDGRPAQTRRVRVAPNASGVATFDAVPVPEGSTRATVRAAAGDALPADDVLHFTVSRGQVVRVLLAGNAGTRGDNGLYLQRALAVGERPPFRVDLARARELGPAQLADRSLVILDDAPPSAAGARLLASWVANGGGVLVAMGEASTAAAWRALGDVAAPLLAARPGDVVDRTDAGGARLASLERAHPVFLPFAAPRSGDLTAPRILRYRALEPASDATVLARFDDGAPALVERTVGRGRVLVWASTLDSWWGDLPLQPVFVPLVHQMAKRAAGYVEARPWYTAGETADLARAAAELSATADSAGWVVETPSGGRVRVAPASAPASAAAAGAAALAVAEQGFYVARPASGRAGRDLAIAVNVDPTEADPARIAPAEIVRAVAPDAGRGGPRPAAVATRAEREQRQSMWWWLLLAALALLGGETLLSNRLSRRSVRVAEEEAASGDLDGTRRPRAA